MVKGKGKVVSEKQPDLELTSTLMSKMLGRMLNWKSPGSDLVQEYWLKKWEAERTASGLPKRKSHT